MIFNSIGLFRFFSHLADSSVFIIVYTHDNSTVSWKIIIIIRLRSYLEVEDEGNF